MHLRSRIIIFYFLVALNFLFYISKNVAAEEILPKVLISEIKIESESSVYDEFIELYNPNNYAIDLSGWSLKKITSSGGDGGYVSSDLGVKKETEGVRLQIPAFGYFLIVPQSYSGDMIFGNHYSVKGVSLAKDNSIVLYDNEKNIIDSFGWGKIADVEQVSLNPDPGKSLERKIVGGLIQVGFLDTPNPQNNSIEVLESSNGGDDGQVSSSENIEQEDDNEEDYNETQSQSSTSTQSSSATTNNTNQDNIKPKIIITEFLINPEDSDKDNEFIEIYNAGKSMVDVSGWILEDQVGSIKQYKIIPGTKINSEDYVVFYSDKTGITLNNSGDGVILRNSSGLVINKTPVSTEAQDEISYAIDEKGEWFWTSSVTAGFKNIIKEVVKKEDIKEKEKDLILENTNSDGLQESFDFSDGVIISEILPDPFGKDNQEGAYEWIELFNESNEDINLKGWFLDDTQNKGSKIYQIKEDLIIGANKNLIISSQNSKLFFNNPGDEVNLFWPDGNLVDSVEYKKSKEGYSYSLFSNDGWLWSSKPSPGSDNVLTDDLDEDSDSLLDGINSEDFSENEVEKYENKVVYEETMLDKEQYQYVDISSIKDIALHSLVGLDGIVSTPPGIFAENLFYLYDQKTGEGVQVYGYDNNFSGINLGDSVQIFGFVSEVGGERRVVVNDVSGVEKISEDNLLTFPFFLTGDLGKDQIGGLAQIKGKVVSLSANGVLYIDDGTGKVKIYIKPLTGINPRIQEGDQVLVRGQVSRTSLGIRILPRFSGDISFLERDFGGIINDNKEKQFFLGYSAFNLREFSFILFFLVILDWIRIRFVYNRKKYAERS